MRGAFTAGALSWFIDHDIDFDAAYGISTGALHLSSYLLKDKEFLYNCSTYYLPDKNSVGIRALFKEGRLVSYEYLMNTLKDKGFNVENLSDYQRLAKIGLYDLGEGKTIYMPIQEMTMPLLKAACSLPIIGKVEVYNDHRYLDGGITKMIPIEQAIEDGCDRFFVIATKPLDYIRKPANGIVKLLMKICYPDCPSILEDYKVRHLNYQKQISLIQELVSDEKAIYMCPSRKTKVTRLGGSHEELDELYKMGYQDMENRKEDILKLLND